MSQGAEIKTGKIAQKNKVHNSKHYWPFNNCCSCHFFHLLCNWGENNFQSSPQQRRYIDWFKYQCSHLWKFCSDWLRAEQAYRGNLKHFHKHFLFKYTFPRLLTWFGIHRTCRCWWSRDTQWWSWRHLCRWRWAPMKWIRQSPRRQTYWHSSLCGGGQRLTYC